MKKPTPTPENPLRTPAEARQWLSEHGVTLIEFAERHKLKLDAVRNALYKNQHKRGQSHAAAVALGIKPRPNGRSPLANPTDPLDTL